MIQIATQLKNELYLKSCKHRSDLILGSFIEDGKEDKSIENSWLLDPLSVSGRYSWLKAARAFPFAYALSNPVGSLRDWKAVEAYCKEVSYLCAEEVLVLVTGVEGAKAARDAGYTLAVYGDNRTGSLPAWPLPPARVWIYGGHPRTQWLKFCELSFCGLDVRGVILDFTWWEEGSNHRAFEGDPYRSYTHGLWTHERSRKHSIDSLIYFWRAISRVFPGPVTSSTPPSS